MRRFAMRAVVIGAVVGLLAATAAQADGPWHRPRPGAATMLVVVSRPWSNVEVDGRRLGPTPVRLELPAGRHRLVLRAGDGRVHRQRFLLRAGETVRIMHRF